MQKQRYTLSDVYNAARLERHFNYAFWLHVTMDIIGTNAMHCAGFCLVILATVLITVISILGFLVVLPAIFVPGSLWLMGHNAWGVFVVFSIYFHYYMAVFTKPGSPADGNVSVDIATSCEEGNCDQTLKLCKKCNYNKPKRTHHCSICNSCVLKMDHHCPWVSNCVGYRNYRYFFGFLFWATVGTMYVSAMSGYTIIKPGSALNPDGGKTDVVTRLFGSKHKNIYTIIYDVLSGDEIREVNKKKNLRGHGLHGSHADAIEAAEANPSRQLTEFSNPTHSKTEPLIIPAEYITLSQKMVGGAVQGRQLANEDAPSYVKAAIDGPRNIVDIIKAAPVLDWLAPEEMLLFVAFMLATGVWIGTGTLLMLHTFLVCNGYTTLEYFEADALIKQCKQAGVQFKHPFDRGIRQNFAEVFGDLPWYLMLLPSVREPPVVVFPPAPDLFAGTPSYAQPCVSSSRNSNSASVGSSRIGSVSDANNTGSAGTYQGQGQGQPRWERNTPDSADPMTLIQDRPAGVAPPRDTNSSSAAGSHAAAVVSRMNVTSPRRVLESPANPWEDKSK